MNRADRNNNPTNIKVPSGGLDIARKRYGDPNLSVDPIPASDGGQFLKFSSPDYGKQATSTLLKTGYSDMSVNDAMKRWSGGGYDGKIVPDLSDKKVSDLNSDEMDSLTQSMGKREGYTGQLQNMLGVNTANAQTTDNASSLKDEDRTKLDGIVQQMITNKESEQNIQSVVDDFKQKYSSQTQTSSQETPAQDAIQPSQQSQSTTQTNQPKSNLLEQYATGIASGELNIAKKVGDFFGLKPSGLGQKMLQSSQNLDNGLAKTAGEATTYAFPAITGGLGLLLGAVSGTTEASAMASKPIMELLAKDTGIDATKLSASTITNTLKTALDSGTLDQDTGTLAEQALKELENAPSQAVKQSKGIFQGLKHLGELGVAYKYLSPVAKSLYDKYVGSQIASPNPNNTMTINPAP